jgi:hypothetical protein
LITRHASSRSKKPADLDAPSSNGDNDYDSDQSEYCDNDEGEHSDGLENPTFSRRQGSLSIKDVGSRNTKRSKGLFTAGRKSEDLETDKNGEGTTSFQMERRTGRPKITPAQWSIIVSVDPGHCPSGLLICLSAVQRGQFNLGMVYATTDNQQNIEEVAALTGLTRNQVVQAMNSERKRLKAQGYTDQDLKMMNTTAGLSKQLQEIRLSLQSFLDQGYRPSNLDNELQEVASIIV